ncbi:MAG: PA14 domain-containing protein [Caldilineaceae bacterium]
MRRFSLLLFSLFLALIAQRLLANSDAFISYVLRDGMLLTAIAALFFAANSLPPPSSLPSSLHHTSVVGWVLIGTGILCTAAAGLLFVLPVTGVFFEQLRPTLWSVGMLLLLLGALSRPRITYALPTVRWQKSNLGDFELAPLELSPRRQELMREKVGARTQAMPAEAGRRPARNGAAPRFLAPRTEIGLLLIVLMVGALLRIWSMDSLPAACLPSECETLLRLEEQPAPSLFGDSRAILPIVQSLLMPRMDDDLLALRLAGALLSVLTLLGFYGFARGLASASGALAATALLAVSPWHLWAMGETNVAVPLLVSLCGWLVLAVWRAETVRWPTLAGMGLGLMLPFLDEPRAATAIWVLLGLLLGAVMVPADAIQQRVQRLVLPLLIALAVASPWLARVPESAVNIEAAQPLDGQVVVENGWSIRLEEMTAALFWRGDYGPLGPALDGSLLGALMGALFLLGVGVLARTLLLPASIWLGLGLLIYGWAAVQIAAASVALTDTADAAMQAGWAGLLLPMLPLIFGGAALALDQLLIGFHAPWRRLILPGAATGAALLILTMPALPTVQSLLAQAGRVGGSAQSQFDGALSQYLSANLAQDPATYFIPTASLTSRSLKVMLGSQLDTFQNMGHLRGLDLARDLVFPDTLNGAVYLVPAQENQLIDLLQRTFPAGVNEPVFDEQSGQPLLTAFRVDPATLASSQGVRGYFFPGLDAGPIETASLVQESPTLQFDWSQGAPLEAPFTVRWEGALLAPEAGNYRFMLNAGPEAQTTLRLDQALVLDSAQSATDRALSLGRGVYQLELIYTALPTATPLALLWQPPGGGVEPIPSSALRAAALPVMGLLGAYSGGAQEGGFATLQKDLLVGLDSELSNVNGRNVRWSGKLAAVRAGEYMLAALSEGDVVIRVQGQPVVDKRAGLPDAESINYAEGLIYLEAGWRDIEIEYVASGVSSGDQPGLRLFWQPPGSDPELLPNTNLAPALADLGGRARPLPPAPPLMDARLGDDRFALSVVPAFRNAQMVTPPQSLPAFDAAPIWQISNGCGNGDGQFDAPRGVVIDAASGRVYVADTLNARVVELSAEGAMERMFSDGQFQEPVDLEILPGAGSDAPTLLVLDAGAQQIFTLNLGEVNTATPLPLTATFYHPRGFDADAAGNLLVADTGGGRLVALNSVGQELAAFGGPESILGQGQPGDAMLVGGRYWAITAEDGRLWRMETAANDSGSFTAEPRSDTLNGPRLAGLPDGRFFLSDPIGRTILFHAPNGEPRGRFPVSDQFARPVGIDAVLRNGLVQLAVTDTNLCTVSLWQVGGLR